MGSLPSRGLGGIAVGAATAVRDDTRLTVRGAIPARTPPRRVVFDRSSRLPLSHGLLQDASGALIVILGGAVPHSRQQELREAGVEVVVADGFDDALRQLGAAGIDSLLVEGGGRLAAAMLGAAVVDRIYQVQAPVWLGAGTPAWPGSDAMPIGAACRWRTVERRPLGDDTLIVMER